MDFSVWQRKRWGPSCPKTGTEDADCGRANQTGSPTSQFEHCSGG